MAPLQAPTGRGADALHRSLALVAFLAVLPLIGSAVLPAEALCAPSPAECPPQPTRRYFDNLPFTENDNLQSCVRSRCNCTMNWTDTSVVIPDGRCPAAFNSEDDASCARIRDCYRVYYTCLVFAARWRVIEYIVNRTEFPRAPADWVYDPSASVNHYPDEWAFRINDVTDLMLASPGFAYHETELYQECAYQHCSGVLRERNCHATTTDGSARNTTVAGEPIEMCAASYITTCVTNPLPLAYRGRLFNQQLCATGCVTAILLMAFIAGTAVLLVVCCVAWPSPRLKDSFKAALVHDPENGGGVGSNGEDSDYGTGGSESYPWSEDDEDSYHYTDDASSYVDDSQSSHHNSHTGSARRHRS